jgi:hypothetical protein
MTTIRQLFWAFLDVPWLGISSTASLALSQTFPENHKLLILPGLGNDSIHNTIDRSLTLSLEE